MRYDRKERIDEKDEEEKEGEKEEDIQRSTITTGRYVPSNLVSEKKLPKKWFTRLRKWLFQISIVSVEKLDVNLQIFSSGDREIKLGIYGTGYWSLLVDENVLFNAVKPTNGYLKQLKVLYKLFPPEYLAPFNVWLSVMQQLFLVFRFQLLIDEIKFTLEEQNDVELPNVWCARPSDFHPVVSNRWRKKRPSDDDDDERGWFDLKWPRPILSDEQQTNVRLAIDSAIIVLPFS